MKGFWTYLIIGFAALQVFIPFVQARTFTDVSENHPYHQSITTLTSQGIVAGYDDGSFRPDAPINRAEVAKVLIEATFSQQQINTVLAPYRANNWHLAEFDDVLTDSWYAPYVVLAKKSGTVQGYPDGNFRPSGHINFAEGLKMVIEAFDADVRRLRPRSTDLVLMRGNEWFAKYVTYARSRNLIDTNKFYHPGQLMTRAEFVELLNRMKTIHRNDFAAYQGVDPKTKEYRITIPKLDIVNMDVAFADPYDADGALDLLRRVPFGHYLAKPGSGKKFVLFGHSSGYAWDQSPFKVVLRQINKLQAGDRIYINFHGTGFVYEVNESEVIAEEKDYTILDNTHRNEMAVYTCWPPDSTDKRYVIYARPIL